LDVVDDLDVAEDLDIVEDLDIEDLDLAVDFVAAETPWRPALRDA
jgi:hypothetical protein